MTDRERRPYGCLPMTNEASETPGTQRSKQPRRQIRDLFNGDYDARSPRVQRGDKPTNYVKLSLWVAHDVRLTALFFFCEEEANAAREYALDMGDRLRKIYPSSQVWTASWLPVKGMSFAGTINETHGG